MSEAAGKHEQRSEPLSNAEAQRLLDASEREAFERAFREAPSSVQAAVRAGVSRKSDPEFWLPIIRPKSDFAAAAVRAALGLADEAVATGAVAAGAAVVGGLPTVSLGAIWDALVGNLFSIVAPKNTRGGVEMGVSHRTVEPVLPGQWFFLLLPSKLAEQSDLFASKSFPSLERWPRCAVQVADLAMRIHGNLPPISLTAEDFAVVAIEVRTIPADQSVSNASDLEKEMRLLLDSASKQASGTGLESLLAAKGNGTGQIRIAVARLNTVEQATEFCRKVSSGGGSAGSGWRAEVHRALAELPADYLERRTALASLSDVFRLEIAAALELALNAKAATFPQDTYEEKKALANWVNTELRALGLSIKGPDGQPCLLMAGPGNSPDKGRFLLSRKDDGGLRSTVQTSVTLPRLQIVPSDLTRKPRTERTGRER